jgi:hypothetical protein
VPYHPAAVQFLKEKNLWNAKVGGDIGAALMDEVQKRLLAVNP